MSLRNKKQEEIWHRNDYAQNRVPFPFFLFFNTKNYQCFMKYYLTLTKAKIIVPGRKVYLKLFSEGKKISIYIHMQIYLKHG